MKPDLRIFHNAETLSRHAAKLFIEQSERSIAERDRFLVVLNGGSTPTRLFQLLATDDSEQVEWGRVHVFWGDERTVLPDDAGSNYAQARGALLDHVPIPESNIHRVKGELEPVPASEDYARVLRDFIEDGFDIPRFDLVYLGMGEDGHTASLFPGSPVYATQPVIPVTAHYQDRPAKRVTLTQLVFNHARIVVFMVTGEKKAIPLAEVLSERYNPDLYPAQRIDPTDGELIWLVDEGAASKLPKKLRRKICEG